MLQARKRDRNHEAPNAVILAHTLPLVTTGASRTTRYTVLMYPFIDYTLPPVQDNEFKSANAGVEQLPIGPEAGNPVSNDWLALEITTARFPKA